MDIDEIIAILEKAKNEDVNPLSGKLFAYVYETGDENIREVAKEAVVRFCENNLLDFTAFRSAILFEKEVVGFARKLMHGNDDVVGSYTLGGTEAIMLAVKAARDYYRTRGGKAATPEILAPVTIHPAFSKAAHYLGLKVKKLPVVETKGDVDAFSEAISERTALIAVSAPNWPYGTVDPVKEIAEIAEDKGVLLHVDACLGGYILPFFEMLGEKAPLFDFRVEGVTSISLDAHKYGYAPKGASVVLFRDAALKKHSVYVDVSSPGYVFVNQAVLSSRPEGPLAAAFAVLKYLGEEGYRELAAKVLSARNRIYRGMREFGFESVGAVESSILSLHSDTDLLDFVNSMKKIGWHPNLQKGLKEFNIPDNIHLTIFPIHDSVADDFLADAEKALKMKPEIDSRQIYAMVERGEFGEIIKGIEEGKVDSSVTPLLLESIPEETAVELIKNVVLEWFR